MTNRNIHYQAFYIQVHVLVRILPQSLLQCQDQRCALLSKVSTSTTRTNASQKNVSHHMFVFTTLRTTKHRIKSTKHFSNHNKTLSIHEGSFNHKLRCLKVTFELFTATSHFTTLTDKRDFFVVTTSGKMF